MVKSYLKRKKVLAAGMAAALVASAFQPASCNLNISPEMLGDLVEAVGGDDGHDGHESDSL